MMGLVGNAPSFVRGWSEARRVQRSLLVFALLAPLTACEDYTTPTEGPLRSTPSVSPLLQRFTVDDQLVQLAIELPGGFGGSFIDNGKYHVYLQDVRQGPQAIEALITKYPKRETKEPPTAAQFVIEEGEFTFVQLYEWRRQMSPEVWNLNKGGHVRVTATDIDESTNRVRIGVADESAIAGVVALAGQLNIPIEAVTVEVTGVAALTSTLNDSIRPVVAGTELRWWQNGESDFCTLGPTLDHYDHGRVFIANSHCGTAPWWVTPNAYYQSRVPSWVGGEVLDPPLFTGGSCPSGSYCRWSDAALVALGESIAYDLGYIARTEYPSWSN
jgi:hypothetical protein